MRQFTGILVVVVALLAALVPAVGAYAWDVEYDASDGLLPTAASPEWQFKSYGSPASIVDGTLHIGNSSDGGAGYRREAAMIGAGVPVTMEARMCVPLATSGGAILEISTYGSAIYVGIYPSRIVVTDRYHQAHTFFHTLTTFHTIRLAYDGDTAAYIWVDSKLAISWTAGMWGSAGGPPGGVHFGSYLSDSYWQYVAYSKEFVPVPEPSSLAALGAGLLPLAVGVRRRCRRAGGR